MPATRRRPALRLALAAAALLASATLAEAHRLKLFVTTDDGALAGYAFFVGGGRPAGVDVVVRDAAGGEVHRGKTDENGNFRWRPPAPAAYRVTVDAGDGHWVDATVGADTLAVPAPATPPAPSPATPTLCPDAPDLAARVAAEVDAALARRLRPLIEAQVQAEGRLRFNDVMGGVGMIVGLAGAALWATARRRRPGDAPTGDAPTGDAP